MTTKEDGGPAFPVIAENGLGHIAAGMSLRDYFAAQCMRDTFAARAAAGWSNFNEYQLQRCAQASYLAADAMLAERSK